MYTLLVCVQSAWWGTPDNTADIFLHQPLFAAQLESLKRGVNVVFDLANSTSSPSSTTRSKPTGAVVEGYHFRDFFSFVYRNFARFCL